MEFLAALFGAISSTSSLFRSDRNACLEGLIDKNIDAPPKNGSW